jgi:RNA polymerase sigma-70 factor (ECF subfamily)
MKRVQLEAMYVRYGPMVLRRARRLLREEQAAKDSMQEVFLRALRALRASPELMKRLPGPDHGQREGAAPGEEEAGAATWLYRITTNYCLNVIRDGSRRTELWGQHGAREEAAAATPGFARVQLAQIAAVVSPELLEIAQYHLVDELTHEEIAELLGVSRRTIGNRLDELRAAVRRLEHPPAPLSEAS